MQLSGYSLDRLCDAERLDLATVIKVSQAVSGEIVLEKLIDRLMRTALEQAGAERGLLIVSRSDKLQIEAEATTSGGNVTVRVRDGADIKTDMPESLVRYVIRTQENVILDDASSPNPFSADPHMVQRRARSILTLPLIHQSKLTAVLYLENNLTASVFTPDRIAILKLLASQAATSLENSRLYCDLEQRELRRLVEANIVGMFIWDLEGLVLEANDEFLRIVGYDRDDLKSGRIRWTDMTPPEWLELDATQRVPELKAKGTIQPFEKEYFRKDGSRVPVLIGVTSFEETTNQGVAYILDLSEQKRAEEALRRSESQLAYVTRVTTMGELTAALAHEIKQPIGAAVTNAEACLRFIDRHDPDLLEAREAALEMVKDARRAAQIIDRVRSLYQKGSSQMESVDLNQMIEEMAVMMMAEANRHAVTIRTDLAQGLSNVMADRVQLQQALMNLILNAVEAMQSAGGELSIKSQLALDDQLLISVSDTGVGLPVENLDKIFNAFFTTKTRGTGLGLAITRSVIQSHGGHIWATVNSGRGATLQFTLPLKKGAHA